jgi:hypothetical protein
MASIFCEIKKMKKILLLSILIILSGCIQVGEFSPQSHELYEAGKPDCEKNPERCYKGIPW